MTTNYNYHKTIRKVIVAFGNIFNNISLSRYDASGEEQEHFLVPLVYGGKEKYVSRLEGDPNLDKKVQVTLPIMSYEMKDMRYDSARKLNTNMRNAVPGGAQTTTLTVYNPVPFDFEFSLFAYVRNIEDGAQLMEKIIPFFTPDYTINVNLIPEMGLVKQLPIILKDVSHEVDYESDYSGNVRNVIWTLNFTIKGYLYGPVTQSKIIRTSITNVFDDLELHDRNVLLDMSVGGLGNYKEGETVYQGYSYSTATSVAKVVSWNSSIKRLEVHDLIGHFVTGQALTGLDSNATWTPSSAVTESNKLMSVTVTPNPSNVIPPNNYTYTTVVTEFPNIP